MTQISADAAAALAARAAAVIPGGVNSGQRRVPGLEELVVTATSGSTFTDAEGRVFRRLPRRLRAPAPRPQRPGRRRGAREARSGLMGVGVTPVEIELAERLVDVVPSLEKVLLTATGSEATFHALRLARTVTGRRHVLKFQGCYHGWHDSVAMNVISPAERVGGKRLRSRRGSCRRCWTRRSSSRSTTRTPSSARSSTTTSPRSSSSRSRTTSARSCRSPASSSGCASSDQHGTVLVFDEVITGFRHGLGGYQASPA